MKKEQTVSEKESWPIKKVAELETTFLIDLKKDFAFKWAFGTPGHEDLLLLLLNGIMPEKHIKSVSLGPQDQKSDREDAQGGIVDILCDTDDGSTLTIEMQVCPHRDFNDRMVFYSSYPIRNRVGQGTLIENGMKMYSKYKLPPIYTIGILDFELEGVSKSERIIRHFSIREDEEDQGPFTDSVHYITVELPKFKKEAFELKTNQDFMIFLLQNSGEMKEIPEEFLGKGFDKLLETCMFANMTEEEQMTYVRQMKVEWDRENQLNYAVQTAEVRGKALGHEEGRKESLEDVAKTMRDDGIELPLIAKYTGLTLKQIEML